MVVGIRRGSIWLVCVLALGCTDPDPGGAAGSREAASGVSPAAEAGSGKAASDVSPAAEAGRPNPDAWVGRWVGPEGTYLDIRREAGGYAITIKDLDAARTFEGAAADDGIEFERDGVRETLHATDGDGSGMKWLAGKQNCLTVRRGEGYCRD